MKKIGILTINDNNNFGNRLQNYASQEVLKKYNCEVETIENFAYLNGLKKVKRYIKDMIKSVLGNMDMKKRKYFLEFNKNINFSKMKINAKKVSCRINNQYDYFFTGSDQVWNPTFGRMSDIDFLTFASKEKRNSISASFGISEIPENLKEYYKERLNNFHHISVREDRGKEIVEELTGRQDVEVLVDPTMLLTAEEWNKVAKKPKQLKSEKYILNYFLGELSEDRKNEINRIAEENNCEIINLLDRNSPFYVSGPSEFVYLEKNAFLICTDSFHSSVFAILYDRPFIVFSREDKIVNINMNSRLETLINKFDLKNRRFEEKITEENLKHDYTEAYEILDKEREKADKFLENVLRIGE